MFESVDGRTDAGSSPIGSGELKTTNPYSINGQCQAKLVLIAYASSESSGEPAHLHSLIQAVSQEEPSDTESQIPGPSEWLGMRS